VRDADGAADDLFPCRRQRAATETHVHYCYKMHALPSYFFPN